MRTGDKYRQDADGFLIHCGRSDEMLKVGGIWVSPMEVESALMAHDAVLEAAVIASYRREWPGEAQGVSSSLKDGFRADDALRQELQEFRERRAWLPTSIRGTSSS